MRPRSFSVISVLTEPCKDVEQESREIWLG
jgi:hypothetical protein